MSTTTAPATARASALWRLTGAELRMFGRERSRLLRLLIPFVLMVIFGAIPFYNTKLASLGGYTLFDTYLPILITYALGMVALTGLPTVLAGYRERGVLRRLRTTPAGPLRVLAAQLVTQFVAAAVMVVLIIAVARLAYGTFLPRQAGGFVLAAVLSILAMLAVGLLIAAVARSGQAAQGIGLFVFFPLMFFSGLFFPVPVMPRVLQHVSHATPLGAAFQALADSWQGHWPHPLALLTLAAYAVACSLAAAKLFRWE